MKNKHLTLLLTASLLTPLLTVAQTQSASQSLHGCEQYYESIEEPDLDRYFALYSLEGGYMRLNGQAPSTDSSEIEAQHNEVLDRNLNLYERMENHRREQVVSDFGCDYMQLNLDHVNRMQDEFENMDVLNPYINRSLELGNMVLEAEKSLQNK